MSPSGSETPSKKRNGEASKNEEVFDFVFEIFMDVAVKAETLFWEEQTRWLDYIMEAFRKLRPFDKGEVLKEMWEEIAQNLLGSLSEERMEAFLVRCFNRLYPKLSEESRKKIDVQLKSVGLWVAEVRIGNCNHKASQTEVVSQTEEVFDAVSAIFMDFADKAEIIAPMQQTRLIAPAPNVVHGEEHKEYNNIKEAFEKLVLHRKKSILKDLWGESLRNLLERLPEEGKEPFLVRCFNVLYLKLPEESRKMIHGRVKHFRNISETKVALDSLFDALANFMVKAETTVSKQQTRLTATAPNVVRDEEHEGLDNAKKAYDELQWLQKAKILKELWVEIAWNLLERLPKEDKEALLVRCFDALYQKRPTFRSMIEAQLQSFVMDAETIARASEIGSKNSSSDVSETNEIIDSLLDTFIHFVDEAEAIFSKQQMPNVVHDEEHEGLDNAREAYDKLCSGGKVVFLKMLLGELASNLLETLPKEEWEVLEALEAFKGRCFVLLYRKLPEESRKKIDKKIDTEALAMSILGPWMVQSAPDEAGYGVISRTKVHYPSQVGRPSQPNPPPQPHPPPNPPPSPPRG